MDTVSSERWENVKNMFALVIGINDYSHVSKLKGAVGDADRFKTFLLNRVKIQADRIITLHDKQATRKAIIGAFRDLWESPAIKRDDPILIFYAGHGCEMPRPQDWEAGGQDMIQAICPCDMTNGDSSNKAIHPIPDRTIAVWLNVLSYKKGHNITVILDCCHSAGATRVPEEGERYVRFDGNFPRALECEYSEALESAGGVPLNYVNQHSRSHVLLAACSATEAAQEKNREGIFTTELLRALEEDGVDQLSFLEFTKSLRHLTRQKKIVQTPQCYGHFKDRIIFSNRLKLGSDLFPASWNPETQTYRIEAGLIHGVDQGSLFDVYETAAIDTKPLFTLTSITVQALSSTAVINEPTVKLPRLSPVARQLSCGNPLIVHFTPSFLAAVNQEKILSLGDIYRKIKVEHITARADFIIDIDKQKMAVFTTNLKNMTEHGFERLPNVVRADPESVYRVLLAASRWKQHLEIPCHSPLAENICIEFFRLNITIGNTGLVTKPMGNKLNPRNDLVYLDIRPNNYDYFGMKIQNDTPKDLHFSMLAFDISDLDITSSFSGPIGVQNSGGADPTLYSKKYLSFGYGDGGGLPFCFRYPLGQVNVTILKMYFTTNPIDLKWLEQNTPFEDDRQDKRGMQRHEAAGRRLNASASAVFTKTFTIVQRPLSS